MPAQRSVVRDDGMRTQQAHAAHAAKRPQSSVPGGQEVRVSDDLAMGSTDESNNETKLTNSEAAGNQGKANIDTGNGMQLKTFTPGVEDVDGMPASKGEGGYSYVQIEGDSTALGGGPHGSLAEDKEGDGEGGEEAGQQGAGTTQEVAGDEQVYEEPEAKKNKAEPVKPDRSNADDGLFSRAEKGVTNIMHNLNVLAKGAANQQKHLQSHREAIVQLKDKFYELKNAILVKMGILKDRLKKMQDGMGKAQEYEGEEFKLSEKLKELQVVKPAEHEPLKATTDDAAALGIATGQKPGDADSLQNTDVDKNAPFLKGSSAPAQSANAVDTGGGNGGVNTGQGFSEEEDDAAEVTGGE